MTFNCTIENSNKGGPVIKKMTSEKLVFVSLLLEHSVCIGEGYKIWKIEKPLVWVPQMSIYYYTIT